MTPQERKVFELALRACENIVNSLATHDDEGMIEHAQPMIDARDSIAAIKEVLAQPEYQSTADKSKLEKVPAKGTLLAQPEPPPECPMDSYGDGNVYRGQRSRDSVVKTITLAQPEEPCDMGKMCIGCSPRNADGNCPDAQQEPVAWLHVMDNTEGLKANGTGIVLITQKRKHPFGKPGIDFSKSYPVTSTPLYTAPPQRTWVGLSTGDIKFIEDNAFSKQRAILMADAILKEKNHG